MGARGESDGFGRGAELAAMSSSAARVRRESAGRKAYQDCMRDGVRAGLKPAAVVASTAKALQEWEAGGHDEIVRRGGKLAGPPTGLEEAFAGRERTWHL